MKTSSPPARRRSAVTNRWRLTRRYALALGFAITSLGCTHLLQTDAGDLPGRMRRGDFSFQRPARPGWYLRDTVDPPTIVEFTRHDGRAESQILVFGVKPKASVRNASELTRWAENLPDGDKVIAAAPGHGATCIRYHGRSVITVNYANTTAPSADRLVTDEDSLECIDPHAPGFIVRFICTQRSPTGGTAAGTSESDAFLSSIQFEK
ncbi:MAG TPA: hypothetical protein VMV27_00580 [Candidatus Binataceae bacterium]|nr:hypothetical protein [Candidatus Binataceae bacterium]